MKQILLSHISNDKKNKLEPFIDEVLHFYGGSIDLSIADQKYSQFFHDVNFHSSPAKAKGRVIISKTDQMEAALVHELLHLSMPLKHKVYCMYFDPKKVNHDHNEFVFSIQNIVEHDLMIQKFLELGYSKKQFLKNSYNPVDYKKEKLLAESKHYWMFEYFRFTANLHHIDEKDINGCRKSIQIVREIALKRYPELQDTFKAIREWLVSKSFHDMTKFPAELLRLLSIFQLHHPLKYLTPLSNGDLIEQAF